MWAAHDGRSWSGAVVRDHEQAHQLIAMDVMLPSLQVQNTVGPCLVPKKFQISLL